MVVTTDSEHINYQRIERAIQYLYENFRRQPELEEVAGHVHLSPFHFQRIFTEWAGISPKRFVQFLTTGYLKEKLKASESIDEAAAAAGLSGQSRVYDLFTTLEAMTPAEYREAGSGIRISYGFHPTPFGRCLIGVTPRGICWLSFLATDQDDDAALQEMTSCWFNSSCHLDEPVTRDTIARIFGGHAEGKLHVLVKGTNFQVKVWEALLRIPSGELATYEQVAMRIRHPKALQAVGAAVGSNTIAFLIPCHRVIRKDGILGEYRWSPARKKSMIGWELARYETPNNH